MGYRDHLIAGNLEPWNDTQVYFLQQEWRGKPLPTAVTNALIDTSRASSRRPVRTNPPPHTPLQSSFDRHLGKAQAALEHPVNIGPASRLIPSEEVDLESSGKLSPIHTDPATVSTSYVCIGKALI